MGPCISPPSICTLSTDVLSSPRKREGDYRGKKKSNKSNNNKKEDCLPKRPYGEELSRFWGWRVIFRWRHKLQGAPSDLALPVGTHLPNGPSVSSREAGPVAPQRGVGAGPDSPERSSPAQRGPSVPSLAGKKPQTSHHWKFLPLSHFTSHLKAVQTHCAAVEP